MSDGSVPVDQRESSSFAGIHPDQSAEIYRELVAGRVVLRQVYNANRAELQDNPLYNTIYNNLGHFRQLYEHLGFELVFNDRGGFFYVRESVDHDIDEHDENAFRVQVVLLIVGRYFARSGRDLLYLGRPEAGLKDEDLEALAKDEEYSDILRTARFEKGWEDALDFLVKRNFAFRSGARRYFLSSAGMIFLTELVEAYRSSVGDDGRQ
jgi:hypothetical protein